MYFYIKLTKAEFKNSSFSRNNRNKLITQLNLSLNTKEIGIIFYCNTSKYKYLCTNIGSTSNKSLKKNHRYLKKE